MKIPIPVAALSLALVLGLSAGEPLRTFTSADGKKSFQGSLVSYSKESGKVRVKLANGQQAEIPLSALSEKDGKWIKKIGALQIRAAKLEVRLKYERVSEEQIADDTTGELEFIERKKKSKRNKASDAKETPEEKKGRTIRIRKEGFNVQIFNPGKEDLEGLTYDYVFYALRKSADEKEIVGYNGTLPIETIKAGGRAQASTEHINLDRGERILGMVLHIKHANNVIRTVETRPGIEKLEKKIKKTAE